jgi:hypothetical protein
MAFGKLLRTAPESKILTTFQSGDSENIQAFLRLNGNAAL